MTESKAIWGWYPVGNQWLPIICDATGRLIVDLTNVNLCDLGDVVCAGLAQGDIIRRGAAAWNNYPLGAAGQRLEAGVADPAWAWPDDLTNAAGDQAHLSAAGIFSISAQSRMRGARAGAVQAIGTGAWTIVQFDNIAYDEQGEWDAVNFRFIATEAGYYSFVALITFQNMALNDVVRVAFYRNGVRRTVWGGMGNGLASTQQGCAFQDVLAVAQWMDVRVWHNFGANRDVNNAAGATHFEVHKLS